MKTKTLLVAAIALLSANFAGAATMSVLRGTGNPGIVAATDAGTPLSAGGYYMAIGTFTNALGVTEEPIITTEFSSLLAAVSAFDVFASITSPASGATIGTITGSFTATGGADPSVFNLKRVYFLIGNAATAGASTEWGIFKVTAGTSFPANVGAAGSTSVSLPNGTAATPLANAGTIVGNSFQLVSSVPEPSVALLGALGVFGLIRRRR